MTARRISGSSFDTEICGEIIHVEKGTVSITDNTQAAFTRGVPDGYLDGDVAAEVDWELDTKNFNLLVDAAKKAGSFRGIPPHDGLFYANTGDEEFKVEVFGVKLKVEDLLDFESKGSEKLTHKVKGFVTSPDFVHINGVPYLSDNDTRNLLG